MISVTIHLFARARDLVGTNAVTVEVPTPATVGSLRLALATAQPTLAELLPRCAVGVEGDFADDTVPLSASAEVALLPPVSGG